MKNIESDSASSSDTNNGLPNNNTALPIAPPPLPPSTPTGSPRFIPLRFDEYDANSKRDSAKKRHLVRSASPLARRRVHDDDESPFLSNPSLRKQYHHEETIKRVQRVSRNAAMQTKQQFWDSNEIGIGAALSAVDKWEALYNALRNLLVTGVNSVHGLYRTAKQGSSQLEHGILLPIRDWILLPAFFGVEKAVFESAMFLQSPQAQQLAQQSLELISQVPVVGDNVLAPSLCFSVAFMQRSWDIMQSPIPSKEQVRRFVDLSLNSTKWAITSVGTEVYFFFKRADANITRALSHTQWKVLGSGPYATLDKLVKSDVIDHVCERYLSLSHDTVARYELAAHIAKHNPPLYHDIVHTGVLKNRGGKATESDEWLNANPIYRNQDDAFFINNSTSRAGGDALKVSPSALWFRWPRLNGQGPANDSPWIPYSYSEQQLLEDKYTAMWYSKVNEDASFNPAPTTTIDATSKGTCAPPMVDTANAFATAKVNSDATDIAKELSAEPPDALSVSRFPTNAQWYDPDLENDVFVDQKRHAVSFEWCCPQCRQPEATAHICSACRQINESLSATKDTIEVDSKSWWGVPPISARQRPTFWRFYGPGDTVRRATWLLETPRNGLQPFDELAQAVLEDAYLFLQWMSGKKDFNQNKELDGALLTVEVPCPDGTERLVQFSSLSHATAIQKGVFSAVTLFKRRVYRGSWLEPLPEQNIADDEVENKQRERQVKKCIAKAVNDYGVLGNTIVPDTSLRSVFFPHQEDDKKQLRVLESTADLSVPASRFWENDMARHMRDNKDSNVDHLVLVVHGIGEMMRSSDLFGLALPTLSSIVDCCGYLRKNHSEVQQAHFLQLYPDCQDETGRTDYIPVEWHESFSIVSQRRDGIVKPTQNAEDANCVMMKDISLRTIPNMRNFANDTLLDVLYFMSPEHHDMIVSIVAHEMNIIINKFRKITQFEGRVSLIGHSLGSIIAWDILANQDTDVVDTVIAKQDNIVQTDAANGVNEAVNGDNKGINIPAPSETALVTSESQYPRLNFDVDNFFLLGSPIAVFLMIRNQRNPLEQEYFLKGCNRVFNIFHPYDPVAYRIEPCLDSRNCDFEPVIMKHWNGGFRVQYQTKRLWRKLVQTTFRTQQNIVDNFEKSMAYMGLIDVGSDSNIDNTNETEHQRLDINERNKLPHIVTGSLNQGRRIDYMIQEKEIETANEYVAAFAAHSSYWTEKDLSMFIARQISLSSSDMDETVDDDDWEELETNA